MTEKEKLVSLNRRSWAYKRQLNWMATFVNDVKNRDDLEYQIKLNAFRKVIQKIDYLKVKYCEKVTHEKELDMHLENLHRNGRKC